MGYRGKRREGGREKRGRDSRGRGINVCIHTQKNLTVSFHAMGEVWAQNL